MRIDGGVAGDCSTPKAIVNGDYAKTVVVANGAGGVCEDERHSEGHIDAI